MVSLTNSFVELCCKTNYSFLTGASTPRELIDRAYSLGMPALAITDRNGVYGIPKAYSAARTLPNFKLITGAEIQISDANPIRLLAKNREGYGLLCRIITAAHAEKPKAIAYLSVQELQRILEHPAKKQLIALSLKTDLTEAKYLKELFDKNLYLGISKFLNSNDKERVKNIYSISKKFGINTFATNDVHYHHSDRRLLHDAVTAIREGCTLNQSGKKLYSNSERYLKSATEMALLFRDIPGALTQTVDIANECNFSIAELRYRYPSEWIPQGKTAQNYLEETVFKGAQWRYPNGIPTSVQKQIRHELDLINTLNFADYFITIWDIVEYARSKNILCQGRGSAANSVVCYCLGITAIDPVRMGLLFERFISVERGEPPDIDVDFEHERREEVLQYVYRKFGRERAGMVAAVICYRKRASIGEISKVLETATHPERIAIAEKLAEEIKGFPRHLSIHSGGFTLSADPLIETVPIEPARMENRTIVQWDKDDLDTVGLLKVDLLSLGMLSAIRKTCDQVGLTLATIPKEDPKTYAMIQRADTVGVFQIESRAQMNMLGRLQPKNFYDLVIQVAIVRPGPIVGKMVHPYLKRRRGIEPSTLPDPRLEPILGRTLGVPLFQEQVMRMAITLAGFSAGEADELRRAIGAWRSSGSIDKMRDRLRSGLLASGLPLDYVDLTFEQIKGFAEYGFPESHAASFALIAYASAYLKCHHPTEFACGLINSQPMGFYQNHTIIDDAKRHGTKILPLDPNHSHADCSIENGALRLGWRIVYGMSKRDIETLLHEQRQRPFQSLNDFKVRTQFNDRLLHTLAMGDVFKCFNYEPRDALWTLLELSVLTKRSSSEQLSLFDSYLADQQKAPESFGRLSLAKAIREEYNSYGLSLKGHPMQALRTQLAELPKTTIKHVKQFGHGRRFSIAGLVIVRQRPPTAAGTVFATLEDEFGLLDVVVHKDIYAKYKEEFLTQSFLQMSGILHRDRNSCSFVAKTLKTIIFSDSSTENPSNTIRLHPQQSPSILNSAAILREKRGHS